VLSSRKLRTLFVTALAGVLALLAGSPTAAAAADAAHHSYYLALGDSLAIGVQPDAQGNLQQTDFGYPDLLFGDLSPSQPDLQLVKLGCSGETTLTFLAGGLCSYGTFHSQLDAAVAFLLAHRGDVRLVTINLGGNDIGGCADLSGIDYQCVQQSTNQVRIKLSIAMAAIRVAAGSQVPIIGMNFYDPVLAFALFGRPDIAEASISVTVGINDMLEEVYGSVGAPTADVESAFQTLVTTLVTVPGFGEIPLNLARICQYTFMCVPPPVGPDTHPTNEGYRAITDAFEAEL
jgi:lysophospholipase L1-like esterase